MQHCLGIEVHMLNPVELLGFGCLFKLAQWYVLVVHEHSQDVDTDYFGFLA